MRKNKINPVRYIIKKFGGLRSAARAIGRSPSGLHRWKSNKEIPLKSIRDVLIAARKNNVRISKKILVKRA
jgi:hypothetical protein